MHLFAQLDIHSQSVCVNVIEMMLSCALISMFLDNLCLWRTDLALCDKKKQHSSIIVELLVAVEVSICQMP